MADRVYMDLTDFGLQASSEDEHGREYSISEKDRMIYMRSFGITPGVEIFYNDYNTKEHFSGKMGHRKYYQISFCHSGLYESHITAHRVLRVQAKEVLVIADIAGNLDSCMPLGYYKGFHIIFYPEQFSKETRALFGEFSIDIHKLFQRLIKGRLFCRFSGSPSMSYILEALFLASEEGNLRRMKLYMLHLLVELEYFENVEGEDYRYLPDKTMQTIVRIKEYMEQNMAQHITILELSERFHISATCLKGNFKAVYGYSPHEFLKRSRMREAAWLLRGTTSSIAQIGMQAGYENPSKFSAAFASIYGMTPRLYRKQV